jgi:hypothetical protein
MPFVPAGGEFFPPDPTGPAVPAALTAVTIIAMIQNAVTARPIVLEHFIMIFSFFMQMNQEKR